jgi:hypothetical protein
MEDNQAQTHDDLNKEVVQKGSWYLPQDEYQKAVKVAKANKMTFNAFVGFCVDYVITNCVKKDNRLNINIKKEEE